jgi:hypothetical protein
VNLQEARLRADYVLAVNPRGIVDQHSLAAALRNVRLDSIRLRARKSRAFGIKVQARLIADKPLEKFWQGIRAVSVARCISPAANGAWRDGENRGGLLLRYGVNR